MKETWLSAVEAMPGWAAGMLLGVHFLAPVFHFSQNRPGRLGGPISRAKAAWLVHVIAMWVVLPFTLIGVYPGAKWLAVSMGLRAVIELLLCAKGRWRTAYGMGHDVFHLALAGFLFRGAESGFGLWLGLTMLTLVAEIYFVGRFKEATAGPENDIFFIPDGPAHRGLNLSTDLIRMPSQYLIVSVLIAACLK